MYHLHGFFTQNSLKPLYVLEETGADFEYHFVNLMKGEHMSEDFRNKTPVGKVPVLEHNGAFLFESGAICRYVANVEESPLYPQNKMQRAQVDQWMDFFSCHLGHWLSKLFFEQVIKEKAGMGAPDLAACEEARGYIAKQFAMIESVLGHADWLANDALSIADLFAFAYVEQVRAVDFSLDDYPGVKAWFDRLETRDSVTRARARANL